ncbi:hypothetical protein WEU32_06935 [Brevundimonas sp. BH3]|uniref:hypothetical protein n=1 Tax=Brevundimonas sp. BH3 TaxID=3133089 RepID=UPI00325504CF
MISLSTIKDKVRTRSTVSTLREPAFAQLTRLSDVEPADQISAIFLAATAMAEACGLDPHEEVQRSQRMMSAAEGPFTAHVQAIKDYARNELVRRPPLI